MKRLIFDTNIYGFIAKDIERELIVNSILANRQFIVYGNKLIRDELRDIPKKIRYEGKNVRVDILSLYDKIIRGHILAVADLHYEMAENYYKAYKELGGSKSKDSIITDFKIVACASANNIDIVSSDDGKSMLVENAVRAYHLVNSIAKKRTPNFIDYYMLKKILGGAKPDEVF